MFNNVSYSRISFVFLFLAAAVSLVFFRANPAHQSTSNPVQSSQLERDFQRKAEFVLKNFSEEHPAVTVTASVEEGETSIVVLTPTQENVKESEQMTTETLQRDSSVCNGLDSKGKDYDNRKYAINWLNGKKQVERKTTQPRLIQLSCLAQVSAKNSDRCKEIEKALSVALGMTRAGDRVLVVPR